MSVRSSSRLGNLGVVALQLGLIAAFLALWQFAGEGLVDPTLVSRPALIAVRVWRWLGQGVLETAAANTLWVVLIGTLIGALGGVALGMACGALRRLDAAIEPIVTLIFALPKVALIPLFILWFGIADTQKIALTVLVVFFFFFYAARQGLRTMPVALDNMVLLVGATRWQRLRLLYLPASLGWLLAGLRTGLPHAFVAAVTAEVVSARGGLGYLAKTNAAAMNAAGVFAAILTLTVLAAVATGGVAWLVDRSRWTVTNS